MKFLRSIIVSIVLLNALTLRVFAKNDLIIEYDLDNNVVNLSCDFSLSVPRIEIKILSVTGGSGNYTIIPLIEDAVNKTRLSEGEGFSYFFSTADQNNRTIGFMIEDGAGNSCKMDLGLISQLEVVDIDLACICLNEILITIKPGDLTDTLSCGLNKLGEPALFVEVLDISGGRENANFKIKTLGTGEVSATSLNKPPYRFYYAITQSDIDRNQPLGFQIFDDQSCFYKRTFAVPASIKTACNIECFIAGKIELDENNAIQIGCDMVNDELIAYFNYTDVKGGNGQFIYEATTGNISQENRVEPGSLTYSFTPEDLATGELDFYIKDTAVNCITHIDLAQLITAFPYKACMVCDYTLNLNKNSSDNIDTACDLTGDENRVVLTASIETSSSSPILLNVFVGELSNNEVQAGEQFQYRFNASDFTDPDFGIMLGNQFTDCSLINLNYIPSQLFQNCIQVSVEDGLNDLKPDVHISQPFKQQTMIIRWEEHLQVEQIRLINLNGQLIKTQSIGNQTQTHNIKFNIATIIPGLYVLQIQTQRGLIKKKVILLD